LRRRKKPLTLKTVHASDRAATMIYLSTIPQICMRVWKHGFPIPNLYTKRELIDWFMRMSFTSTEREAGKL
jgi:hypothetical protein